MYTKYSTCHAIEIKSQFNKKKGRTKWSSGDRYWFCPVTNIPLITYFVFQAKNCYDETQYPKTGRLSFQLNSKAALMSWRTKYSMRFSVLIFWGTEYLHIMPWFEISFSSLASIINESALLLWNFIANRLAIQFFILSLILFIAYFPSLNMYKWFIYIFNGQYCSVSKYKNRKLFRKVRFIIFTSVFSVLSLLLSIQC